VVYIATLSEYDNIFVIIWVLVIFVKLHLVDGGGTFASMIIIPVHHWPLFPAREKEQVHWPFKE
jgi:hypothetical protein